MGKIVIALLLAIFMAQPAVCRQLSEAEAAEKINQALQLRKAGENAEALQLFKEVGEHTAKPGSEAERHVHVVTLTMASRCCKDLQLYAEGYDIALGLLRGNLNVEERAAVEHLCAMNGYYYAYGLIKADEQGQTDYRRAREIIEAILPYCDSDLRPYAENKIPLSWYFEGMEQAMAQKYAEAQRSYGKALAGYKALGDAEKQAEVLMKIASVKKHEGRLEESKRTYLQALGISRQQGTATKIMEIERELWELASDTGDIELLRATTAAIDSLIEHSGDARVAMDYCNKMGDEALSKHQARLAEQWYKKGLAKASDTGNDKYMCYERLRDLYEKTGQYDEAIAYGHKTIAEYRRFMPPTLAEYYMPYDTQAFLYRAKGDREKCFACIDTLMKALSLIEEPRQLSQIYTTRAACHAGFGETEAALRYYVMADSVLSSKYHDTDHDRVQLLALAAGMENRLGRYADSERRYKLYAVRMRQIYGDKSMESVNAEMASANSQAFAGHIDAGCNSYAEASQLLMGIMRDRIPYMSAEEREAFWAPASPVLTRMTPFALEAKHCHTAFTRSCYDALVATKAFLLESERTLLDVVKSEGSEADMRDYMQLAAMKSRIKELEKDYAANADSIMALSRRAARLAEGLAGRCSSFGSITGFMDIDHSVVRRALKPGEVLLDFTDYVSLSQGRKYAVYVVRKADKYPLLKYLFAEKQVDSLGITRPDMYYDTDYAAHVLRLLWEPLRGEVAEGSTVYYVPTELLFQVSLESIPLPDGTLLGSHYNFVRLTSARELVRRPKSKLSAGPRTAVLYGGLSYDLKPAEMVAQAQKYKLDDLLVMRGDMARGDSLFGELPGSRQEVLRISQILSASKWLVTPHTGMEGTEESFLSMHGNAPQVLHIATHGFYYSPDRASRVNYLRGYTDAMQLSGLVLSGGNAAWRGEELPEGVLGGILTAGSIARLDLSGTEMVVLSACQTGQGRATPEGLYGLQRAFKKAGVGTMVMSLWNVSDKVTTEFMSAFYEQLAGKRCRWDKRKAFERAKEEIRRKYPDPFHWAAFVMLD